MNGYKLDWASKTITITKAFADAAGKGGEAGAEYQLLTRLQKDFPDLTIQSKTHRRPSHYTSKSGRVSRCHPGKNLTYKRMESFMRALPKGNEYLNAYYSLRGGIGKVQTSEYAQVRRWFELQFPNYRKDPLFYLNNNVDIVDVTPLLTSIEKEAA